jgi:hypothetical protein
MLKEKLEAIKKKIAGARKSLTVAVIAVWQLTIQNIDQVEAFVPQLQTYFGNHVAQVLSAVFGAILFYVRVFHTKGSVEDKVKQDA